MANISEIIAELMKFEPELKKYEKELTMVVKALIESKPNTKFDQNFAQNLRTKLISTPSYTKPTISNFNPMKKLSYLFSGVLLALIVVSVGYFGVSSFKNAGPSKKLISMAPNIVQVKANAFGKLSSETPVPNEGFANSTTAPNAPKSFFEPFTISEATGAEDDRGDIIPASDNPSVLETAPTERSITAKVDSNIAADQGVSAGGTTPTPAVPNKIAPDSGTASTDSMIYYPTIYKFVYTGDTFDVGTDPVSVLKRIPGSPSENGVLDVLKNFDLGLMDLGKLKNTFLEYLTLSENRDFGYSLYVNVLDESISISQNSRKWPQCYTESCYTSQSQLTITDVPDDSTLIKMANNFLSEYGIDISKAYGKPIVNKSFVADYKRALVENFQPWIPDAVNVTYPQNINNMEVYNDGGTVSGIDVSVSLRENKVSSLYGLKSQNYEESKYEVVSQDVATQIMEKGGLNNYLYSYNPQPDEKVNEVTIKLGTPVKGYMQWWNYTGTAQEILVEALIFPIIGAPSDGSIYYQQAVVVPLAKDVIAQPNPIIMPLGIKSSTK